ncbi:MAG: phosphatase PAP2 family protein [Eubacteriales bacterium]|nr:phosphatase PAP2 family protein [Eubacteriales bacterium]
MTLLYMLEQIRNPFLDILMQGVTWFGELYIFLVIALVVFWCIDKRTGFALIFMGIVGVTINQWLKMAFRIPRPWVLDPGFTIVETARKAADGYSFPSGHTQLATTTYGGLLFWKKHRIPVTVILACILLAVPFSRMYLGVHTPWDTGTSFCIGLLLVALTVCGFRDFKREKEQYAPLSLPAAEKQNAGITVCMTAAIVLAAAEVIWLAVHTFPADLDLANYASAMKNGCEMAGCAVGVLVIWILDVKKLHFETKAVWWAQILKCIGGIAVVLLVKLIPTSGLNAQIGLPIASAVKYCLMVIVAGGIWPLTFPWFAKLGRKELE